MKDNYDGDTNICIDNDVWENIINKILKREKLDTICAYVHLISIKYNIDKKNIIKDFLNYIIRNKSQHINSEFLKFVENLMHSQNLNNNNHIYYSLSRISSFISSTICVKL
jgi:hypothetical protein